MGLAECFFSAAMKNIGLPRAESLVTVDKIFTSELVPSYLPNLLSNYHLHPQCHFQSFTQVGYR